VDITNTNNLVWEDGMSDLRDIATLCKEIDYLTAQVDTLRKERDEARLNLCDMYTRTQPTGCQMKAEDYAKDHGWDCFKSYTLSQEVSQEGKQQ